MLREMDVPMVIVDEPQGFASSIPLVWEATSTEMVVIRFHGHNGAMWTKKGLATSALRFNYLYSEEELQALAGPVKELASQTKQVHAIFNNCYEDNAQVNAKQFCDLLGV